MSTQSFTKSGNKSTTSIKLPKDIFGLEVNNHELLKQAYITYLSNGRTNNAVVKTRGDVSGGGRKPWRQKGTGRARFGSTRNPIWRKGGVAFGPTGEENYTKKLSVTSKRQAVKQALSLKNTAKAIVTLEDLETKSGKVSEAVNLIKKMDLNGNILLVVDVISENISRSTNNLPNVMVVKANRLNVYDLLNADSIAITEKAVTEISNWLGGKK